MNIQYGKLLLALLLAILVVPPVVANQPSENGPHIEYYENGQKKSETHYKDGKPEGLLTGWYENGQKKSETQYENGKQDGLETRWDETGMKVLEVQYKDGNEVSRKEF